MFFFLSSEGPSKDFVHRALFNLGINLHYLATCLFQPMVTVRSEISLGGSRGGGLSEALLQHLIRRK